MSDQGYDINLNVNAPTGGLDSAIQRLKTLDRQLQQTTSRMNRMAGQVPQTEGQQADAKAIAAVKRAAEQAAQATKVATDRTQRVRIPQMRLPQGPAQRYQQAIANQQAAAVYGTPAQQFDANRAAQIAGKQYQAAIKSTAGDSASKTGTAVARALKSARIGFGPEGFSVSPLLGAIGEFGPLGAAAGGLVAAAAAMKAVADNAVQQEQGFQTAAVTAGGTPQETAVIRGIAAAAGQTPEQGAQAARAFAQHMATSGYAMNFFGPAGIQPDPDPTGVMNPDKARNFIRAVQYLFTLTQEQAQRALHAAPELTPYYVAMQGLTPQERQQYLDQAAQQAAAFGPEAQRQTALYNIQQTRFQQALQARGMTPGQVSGTLMAPVYQAGANAVENPTGGNIARAIGGILSLTVPGLMIRAIAAKAGVGPDVALARVAGGAAGSGRGPAAAQDRHTSALDAHTRAINEWSRLLGDGKRHVFGGGPRTEGAIPAGWRGYALQQARLGGMDRTLGVFVQ